MPSLASSLLKHVAPLSRGRSLVVLLTNGLVQVLWIKADMKGTIRLAGVCEGRHPLGRLGNRCNHPLSNHVVKGVLYLLSVLYGYLPLGMLGKGYVRASPWFKCWACC